MNSGINGVLVLLHSFSLLISVSFSFSVFLHHFSLFSLPKAEDTPIPREFSFLLLDTQHFVEMTAGMSVRESQVVRFSALMNV